MKIASTCFQQVYAEARRILTCSDCRWASNPEDDQFFRCTLGTVNQGLG